MPVVLTPAPDLLSICRRVVVLLAVGCGLGAAASSPTTEFDSPYQVRVLFDGAVIEISGSFSWALPQTFQAVLASTPGAQVVQFESPGGHVVPALEIAALIRERGLATYVGRFCASACTVAFLGGRERWLAPDARLGFHQAHAPGMAAEQTNAFMTAAYERLAVPRPFIARVLATPPTSLWYPTRDELRAAGFTTGATPEQLLVSTDGSFRNLVDVTSSLRQSSDQAVVQVGVALADVFAELQALSPQFCWEFAHGLPVDLKRSLSPPVLAALFAAEKRVADETRDTRTPAPDVGRRAAAFQDLAQALAAKGQGAALDNLRSTADPATVCASLRAVLAAALVLPDDRRARALRAVLAGG